jgi:hypothetical protein
MNPGMRILPLLIVNGLLEGRRSRYKSGQNLSLGWEAVLDRPQVGQRHED